MATSTRPTRTTRTADPARRLGWCIVGLAGASLAMLLAGGNVLPAAGLALALAVIGGLALAGLLDSSPVTSGRQAAPVPLLLAAVLLAGVAALVPLDQLGAALVVAVGAGLAFGSASLPGVAR